jgi:UDP-2,3-diacylglucosamine pyrophosphatase LpxH
VNILRNAHTPYHLKHLLLGGAVLAFGFFSRPDSATAEVPASKKTRQPVLAFVSDTQEPLWIETFRFQRDRNEEATAAIFTALVREPNVTALFHLGDVTAVGSWETEWQNIDADLSMFRDMGVPVFPILGNHDYYIFPRQGKEAFLKRFPRCEPSWYITRIGTIAVVLVNSNFSRLSEQERVQQQQWFETELSSLQQDSAVKSIIVGTHHPPYTNSRIVDPSTEVQDAFIPPFLRCSKCKVFFSGHAHAFEHFQEQGKDFVVMGGGGGLLHPLLTGEKVRWKDLFPANTKRRMFHYLLCEQRGESFHLTVKMLNPDYQSFYAAYEISIGETK